MPDTLLEQPRPQTQERSYLTTGARGETWAIVLAGGEGTRLQQWTRSPDGAAIPKQFCRFRPGGTLLGMALERARRVVRADHILVLVRETHREWWSRELAALPPENVIAQPRDRGTAVAILHALVRVLVRDSAPVVLVMPADHDVEREETFAQTLQQAISEARHASDHPILIGITPRDPDPGLGWIVAADPNGTQARVVLSFVEKPSPSVALRLMEWGALWNSFVIASTATALFRLYEDAQPTLLETYFMGLSYSRGKSDALLRLYRTLPSRDFGKDVLQHEPERLRVMRAPSCGWTDLGTPERVRGWLEVHHDSPMWRLFERELRHETPVHDEFLHPSPEALDAAAQGGKSAS